MTSMKNMLKFNPHSFRTAGLALPCSMPRLGRRTRRRCGISIAWQSGAMTRNQPWLAEMQPNMFVEMSPELAEEKGIQNGEKVTVESARGSIEAVAMVTRRMQPLHVSGQIVHQVGLPWHFGWVKPESGREDSANLLTPSTGDPNTRIPETKAFMVNVTKI